MATFSFINSETAVERRGVKMVLVVIPAVIAGAISALLLLGRKTKLQEVRVK